MDHSARPLVALSRAGWRETTVLLSVAALLPVLVHLVPWSGHRPLGVYLLPVFWTTFLAVYFHGARLGLLTGLAGLAVNQLLTGLPVTSATGSMGLEVGLFTVVAAALAARWPGFRLTAPLAWVAAKGVAVTLMYCLPAFAETEPPWRHLARSAQNGLAGLGVLLAVNLLLVAFYPKTDAWEKE